MSFQATTSLINLIITIFFAVFIYIKNTKSPINKSYAFFTIFLSIWNLGYFLWQISSVKNDAIFWCRILTVGSILIPPTYLCFVTNLVGETQKNKKAILASYFMAAFFLLFAFSPLLIKDATPKLSFKFWPDAGPCYSFYLVYFLCFAIYAVNLLITAYRKGDITVKNRLKYVLIGTAIGYFGGSTNYPLWFNVKIYPFGNIFISLYVILVSYAIVRHQLMDIDVVIKKSLIFASLFTVVFGVFVGTTLLIQQVIGGGGRLLGLAISSIIIILSVRPLEDILTKITDKYLFQKKYDYQQILRSFIDNVITVPDSDKIVNGTTELVGNTLRPEKMAMFLLDKKIRKFVLRNNIGYGEHLELDKLPNILSYLSTARHILSIEHENNKGVANAIIDEMKLSDIRIAVPLIASNELLGVILLGKKKSDEFYTTEDLNALMDLARTEAIAIKNSMVIQELTEEKKIAALGKVASSLSHNINNHLNRARVRIQEAIYTEEILDKLKKVDNVEERGKLVDRLSEHLNRAIDYIDAGADVVKKARDFARPTKGPPSPVNIKTPLEKAIFMVKELKFKEGTRQIPIAMDIAQDVPMVKAKEDDLREVIITVLDNAVDSIRMKELKGLSDNSDNILVKASYIKKLKEVELRVIDTGVGIKKEDLEDIFLRYFTTKGSAALYEDYARRKDVRIKSENNNGVYGTGLGLDLVKSLVEEQIKGTLRAESAGENRGATFIITIPEWLEEKDGKSINS